MVSIDTKRFRKMQKCSAVRFTAAAVELSQSNTKLSLYVEPDKYCTPNKTHVGIQGTL